MKAESQEFSELWREGDDIQEFIHDHNLQGILKGITKELTTIFRKYPHDITYDLRCDLDDGSSMLYVIVLAEGNLSDHNRRLNKFHYDWWYDRIDQWGHWIGIIVRTKQ